MKQILALVLGITLIALLLCACSDNAQKPAETVKVPAETVEKIVEEAKDGKIPVEEIAPGSEIDLSAFTPEEQTQVKQALADNGVEIKESTGGKITVVTVPETPATPDESDESAQDVPAEAQPGEDEVHMDVIPDNPDE